MISGNCSNKKRGQADKRDVGKPNTSAAFMLLALLGPYAVCRNVTVVPLVCEIRKARSRYILKRLASVIDYPLAKSR